MQKKHTEISSQDRWGSTNMNNNENDDDGDDDNDDNQQNEHMPTEWEGKNYRKQEQIQFVHNLVWHTTGISWKRANKPKNKWPTDRAASKPAIQPYKQHQNATTDYWMD